MSFCSEQLYSQCDKLVWSGVLFLSELGLFQTSPTCYNYSQFRARHCSLMFFFSLFFLCHSFSTAYQCIYYSPEHTAKAQEVLNIMSLLQPLITRLVDQLLQAAHEHSSPGLRDALKHLSDKVRQHLSLSFAFTSISPISLFLFTSSCCSTQSIGMSCQMIFTSETRALYINL